MNAEQRAKALKMELVKATFAEKDSNTFSEKVIHDIYVRHIREAQEDGVRRAAQIAFTLCEGEPEFGIEFECGRGVSTEEYFAALAPEKVLADD